MEKKNKYNKGGDIVRFEPQRMHLLNYDHVFRDSFQKVGCLTFYDKLQGYNMEVDANTRIGPLEFLVSEEIIVAATEMPT